MSREIRLLSRILIARNTIAARVHVGCNHSENCSSMCPKGVDDLMSRGECNTLTAMGTSNPTTIEQSPDHTIAGCDQGLARAAITFMMFS